MLDILALVIIPSAMLIICLIWVVKHNNKVATSNELNHRVIKIAKRPRVIRDNNHKFSNMNKLLIPETEESFDLNMKNFIIGSFRR